MDKAQRKIFRSPSVKRKNKGLQILQKLTLERVLGLTVTSNAALSCDPNTGTIAYPAGCVVVLFNPRRNRQSHIFNTTKKTITSVAFSCDGKHLVTGECGHQPAVRVWDVSEKTQIAEFHGHKFGINCVAFSPNLKYIVSVGSQYDMMVNVWNWRTGNKVASNKVSCKVCAVAFSTDSGYFVTVGNRHVKFWYLDCNKSKINQTVPLLGRSGILGEQRNNFFSDVVCGRGPSASSTFVITQSGLLCEFNEKRLLDKWVELRTKSANCLTAGEEHIYVGCAEGVVRVFSANSLHFVTTLPHPHHLGVEVATATSSSDMICTRTDAKYPDTIAIAIDDHCKVACIYNDHSLYVWDVVNVRRVGKAWSFLYHSGCIWALEVYPRLESPQTGVLPPGSFITSSSDDTIRVWNLDSQMSETAEYKRNIYSNELLKVIYTDPSLAYLCDVNFNPAGATDKTDTTWEGKNGVRSIRVSPDGEHLASGDRQGNVRIYDMHQMAEIRSIEAHESDVVCLEYSFSKAGPRILASGSRDRLIHVFDVEQKYGLLQTLDDHSAAIQAVRFTDANNRLRMLSCGSDKSLLFRNVNLNPSFEFVLDQHLVSKATMYDMIIDPTQKFVATACQDRNIRVYNMATAKQKKNYRASCGDEGVLLRVQLDPSGTYAATSCSDKNLCILEFYTGEIICSVNGHSEISTGLRFTNDLKHLISVSADGCIFVWRLPSDMTKTMRLRMEELGKLPQEDSSIDLRREVTLMPNPVTLDISFQDLQHFPVMKENISPARVLSYMAGSATPKGKGTTNSVQPSPADYCFSIGPLPNWAKIRFGDSTGEGIDGNADALQPKGRWAQRFDQNMAFKSQLDLTQLDDEIDRTSEGKLSVSRQTSLPDLRRETVVLSQQHLPLKNIPIIDDDDETNVDDDEEFLPAYFSSQSSNINVESDRSSSDYGDKKSKHRSDSAGRPIDATTTGRNLGSRLSLSLDKTNTNSFDLDDTDDPDSWSDTTEVIYPPNDAETLDTYASTYKVFAVDENGSHSKVRAKQTTLSSPTADEGDSESTDPVSLEDHEDEDAVDDTMITSTASTPSDPEREFPRTPDKEQFVKENFETDAFTPLPIDKFHQQMATLERAADVIDPSNLPFSPRLSLSSRFLSRSQFGIRSLGRVAQRSDDWYDPLRKSKSEIARAMDETRRRLTDINWHSNDVLKNSPEKEDPPSPPTKLENNEPNFSSSPKVSIVSSIASTPSPRTLRRFWADFTLPQQPIKEENSLPRISLPQSLQHMKGDSANTLVTSVNSSKIPLFAAQAADGIELNSGFVCSPTLTKSFRRPVSPDSRFPQSPKLTRSHDQKPVGVVPVVGSRTSSNPQSLHLSRSRITTRPPRPPQSPPSPKPPPSPTSPRSSSCPSSPRPPRSPFSCRSSRSVQSSDVSLQSPKSPRPPRSPLSSRPPLSPLSPDLRSSRNPLPPKALLQFRKIQSSNSGNLPSPTGSPTLDRKGSHSFLQQPPKKPPRSSLNSRSKSPPNSESIRTPSPSIKSESIRSQSPSTRSSESIRSQSPSVKSSESIRSQSPSVKSSDSNRSRSPSTRSSESIRSQSPSVKSSDSIRTPSPNIKSESIRSQSPSVKSSESICSQYSSTRSSETICSQSSNTKSLDSFRLATPTIKSSENIHLVFHSTTTNSDVTEVCESDQLCQQSPEVQKKGSGLEMAITAAGTKGEADNIKSTSVTSPNHIRSTVTARERRRSIIGSRTGEVTSSGSTRSGEVTGGTGTRTGEHSSNSSAAVRQVPSYFRTTKSSRLKSASSSNLMGPFDSQSAKSTVISNKAETGVKKKTGRSRLSSSNHLALYASTPNLTVYHEEVDDIERAIQKTSNLKTLTELSLSVPDINALDDLKSTDSSSPSLPVTGFKDSAGVKQTIKTCSPSVISRLAPDKLANTDFHMDDSGLSNPRSVFQPPNSELMPPPPIGTPLKSTQTNFLRRSVQIRNRSTAELTLEQAKSILLGNSGILCRQTSNEDVPLTSTLPNKKNTYTKSSGILQKNIPCSKTLTSSLSSLTNVSSHANSTSSSVFEPLETDTLPETGFTSATTLAVAEEIERTASRLRRERVAATALGAARYDPPERDRPQTHKVVNPIKIVTSSHSHGASLDKNKEGGKALDRNKEGGKALDKNKEDGKALDKNKEGEKALDLRLSVSPTTKESEELTVKERVARFNQQTVTQTTVEVSHPIHNSIGLSPRNIRVTTSSPLPPDFLGSPRSQSDTGLGSETDTDSEPRHHQVSGLGSSLSRVNRSHLSLHLHNSASPSSTASSASSTASAASDHGVPTESLQICTSILADLRQAVQRAKEFHTQVHSGGSNTVGYQQMMVLMSEAFHEAHLTLAHLALQSPVLPESSTKPPSCPLVEVTGSWDQTVMEKAQDMLQPFVSQLSQELSDELVKLVKDKLQGNPQ